MTANHMRGIHFAQFVAVPRNQSCDSVAGNALPERPGMKRTALLLMVTLLLLPELSEARCRTVGESASLGTEYGTFPLYPAKRLIEAGEKRDNAPLQWMGYGIGLPLFVVAMPFAMVGAGVGAALHPWTKCKQHEDDWLDLK